MTPNTLSARIFWVKEASGLTSREFDRIAKVPQCTLSLLRHRLKTDPNAALGIHAVVAYAKTYGFSLDWLFLGKGNPPTESSIKRRARVIATASNSVNCDSGAHP